LASKQRVIALSPEPSGGSPPEDLLQNWLLNLWKTLLGRTDIGVDDDFFALGGTREQSERLFATISRLCHERLPAPQGVGPLTVRGVAEVVVTKLEAQAHTTTARPAPPRRGGRPAVAQNILQDQLLSFWEELLGTTVAGIDEDFFALGGTRELCERMRLGVEELCGERLDAADLGGDVTVRRLAETLVARLPEAPVREVQPGAPGVPPLFFLHGDLGGGGYYVRELARGLGPEQPVFVLQQHGMHGEDVPSSVDEMAADHASRVGELCPDGPFHLAGHCISAFIALEMAQRFARTGREVTSLLMIEPPMRLPEGKPRLPPPTVSLTVRRMPRIRQAWLFNQYREIVRPYLLPVYHGRTVVFWARDASGATRTFDIAEATASIQRVAPNAEMHICPGTHITALGRHVRSLAAAMKAALAATGRGEEMTTCG
jgi:pimeloyl-ACP methyl ester carboxylesterase